jgi:hypothetical protein
MAGTLTCTEGLRLAHHVHFLLAAGGEGCRARGDAALLLDLAGIQGLLVDGVALDPSVHVRVPAIAAGTLVCV